MANWQNLCADEYKERVYGVTAKLNKALGTITAPSGRSRLPLPLDTGSLC